MTIFGNKLSIFLEFSTCKDIQNKVIIYEYIFASNICHDFLLPIHHYNRLFKTLQNNKSLILQRIIVLHSHINGHVQLCITQSKHIDCVTLM